MNVGDDDLRSLTNIEFQSDYLYRSPTTVIGSKSTQPN